MALIWCMDRVGFNLVQSGVLILKKKRNLYFVRLYLRKYIILHQMYNIYIYTHNNIYPFQFSIHQDMGLRFETPQPMLSTSGRHAHAHAHQNKSVMKISQVLFSDLNFNFPDIGSTFQVRHTLVLSARSDLCNKVVYYILCN
jgi:hypothetical protein